ncbi:MAG: glycosyltransferase [Paludibacter sp.]|nr:glycosyltransferase [Paludibacter sp.]MDD4072541.1 glycosyltransferase [Desulfobacterales bacterium]MDD4428531.1 glycosyltransferase [Paludibacter sp.]
MSEHNEKQTVKDDEIPSQEFSDPAVLSKYPVVSVYMITYNHEPYIAQAIEGVLIQETDFSIELVIGEDCSTDRTREIVLEYQKKHPDIIRVITSEKNVGAKKNGNRTRPLCRGKYIAFCEGDDYWHHPKKLQKQVDYLEAHPECGLVHGDVDRYDLEKGKRMPIFHKEKRALYKQKKILNGMIINEYIVETCTAIVRKKMYDEIRRTCVYEFSEKFLMGDVQTWMEIAHRSEVKYIDESLATRNLLPESACHSNDLTKSIKFTESAMNIALHYAKKYGGEDSIELNKCIVGNFNKSFLSLAYRSKNFNLAKKSFKMARNYQVSLTPIGYLYFVGCHNIIAYYCIKFIGLSVKINRKIFRDLKMVANNRRCSFNEKNS